MTRGDRWHALGDLVKNVGRPAVMRCAAGQSGEREGGAHTMRIIRATETITVEHPVFLIFGQPGICKTSLAYSAKDPLLLDFDNGAHRAVNRRDTLLINGWPDVQELMTDPSALAPYATVIPDTVGRCLDLMAVHIIAENPKLAQDGNNLNQRGWGKLKTDFRTWMTQLRALGKDVALVAHDKEDKDGDTRTVRPDIVGGSLGEVLKTADFIGYLYMNGRSRVLDFNPCDRWFGKNPAGWKPFIVPEEGKATTFLADLMDRGREALGKISERSVKATEQVSDWRSAIETYTAPDECTRALREIEKLDPLTGPQAKKLLWDRAKALGLTYDLQTKRFVEHKPGTVLPATPAQQAATA